MKKKSSLFTGVALGVVMAVGLVSQADAAAAKRKPAESVAARQAAEIEQLKAQVESLSERLLAQEREQQQLKQQAEEAKATAEAARQQAAAQIETIPAQVSTAVAAATPKPKPSWADSTSVNGRMYFNFSDSDVESDGDKVKPSGTGFEIKRFYVGVDHKFNDTFSGNITTDVQYNSNEGLTQLYIKKAYLQAKVSDALIVRLGSADLPWIPFAEDAYGYRFIENTVADRDKFGTSADWGVHALGKIGMFNYAVAAINGAGYKNPVKSNAIDLEGRVSTTYNGFTVGVGGYSGKLGKNTEDTATNHRAQRADALVAYKNDRFRIGAEYFWAKNWNNVTTVASDKSNGYSVFGSFNFTPEISLFGRYDRVKPKKDTNSGLKDQYFNIGINYEPAKIVDLALVYKRDKVDNGFVSTSNGNIGGLIDGTYDEIGLFGQFRW